MHDYNNYTSKKNINNVVIFQVHVNNYSMWLCFTLIIAIIKLTFELKPENMFLSCTNFKINR